MGVLLISEEKGMERWVKGGERHIGEGGVRREIINNKKSKNSKFIRTSFMLIS